MPGVVFGVAVVWLAVLLAGAVLVLVHSTSPFVRILAIDTTLMLVVGFLLLLAIDREQAVYLDAAIALGLLGFATTVALARIEREPPA